MRTTQDRLYEKYGQRLSVEQLADALEVAVGTIYNKIGAGTLAVHTYMDNGKRWCDHRDLALHLDKLRRPARKKKPASKRRR